MMTVKEISKRTGISARTLHYYDEIGLFSPTEKSDAGYRLYDEKALETLQEILFFREFDIPLKEIKTIMETPEFDRNQILKMQKTMLLRKKERIEKLIQNIDEILEGENRMDFEVFSKKEMEEMYSAMEANMTDVQKQIFIEYYGSMEEWKKYFLEKASTEEVQKNFEKVVEWYGSKELALEASMHPENHDIQLDYQKRMGEIAQELAKLQGNDVTDLKVQALVKEYDQLMKQMFQLPDATEMVMEIAKAYQTNQEIQAAQDSIYGEGFTAYMGSALEAYYS